MVQNVPTPNALAIPSRKIGLNKAYNMTFTRSHRLGLPF